MTLPATDTFSHAASALRVPTGCPDIKVLPVELPMARRTIWIVALKNPTLSPVAQLFIENDRVVAKPRASKNDKAMTAIGPSRPCLKNSCPQWPESGQTEPTRLTRSDPRADQHSPIERLGPVSCLFWLYSSRSHQDRIGSEFLLDFCIELFRAHFHGHDAPR
jgi:hypothetical protein